MDMTRLRTVFRNERGFALVYTAVFMTGMLLFTGLAVDGGRAYIVKQQLTKAVDGAALAAARNLNSGNPRTEARNVFRANFPAGYMGTTTTDPTVASDFFNVTTDNARGINIITVKAETTVPTTFMKLGGFNTVDVASSGEATRRMVDLSLVLDVSGSIGTAWPAVESAAETFIRSFDGASDRLSLIFFSDGGRVRVQMRSSRGFDKAGMVGEIPSTLPGGSTAMAEGLYRGWDELRTVPGGQQSSLRVIVLFTDGSPNGVPGNWNSSGTARSVMTADFPDRGVPLTFNTPIIGGFFHPQNGTGSSWSQSYNWRTGGPNSNAQWMPPTSWHAFGRSSGRRTTFPLQSPDLRVNGVRQSTARGLINYNSSQGKYPASVWNINNAARNLVEIVANEARNDESGDYPIRIYTIAMGPLVPLLLGTIPESSESILMRVANDADSSDFNPDQLEGQYFYAQTADDVGPAFQQLQAQIVRLTK
jgi:Flp pilus assembly protein TadG